jgi:hypothetical protein
MTADTVPQHTIRIRPTPWSLTYQHYRWAWGIHRGGSATPWPWRMLCTPAGSLTISRSRPRTETALSARLHAARQWLYLRPCQGCSDASYHTAHLTPAGRRHYTGMWRA